MSCLFTSGSKHIGASASASVLQWIFRVAVLSGWLVWPPCCPRDSRIFSAPQFENISSLVLILLYGPALTLLSFQKLLQSVKFPQWFFVFHNFDTLEEYWSGYILQNPSQSGVVCSFPRTRLVLFGEKSPELVCLHHSPIWRGAMATWLSRSDIDQGDVSHASSL